MKVGLVKKWIPIIGNWEFSGSTAVYNGPEHGKAPYGICVCDGEFKDGELQADVELGDLLSGKSADASGRLLVGFHSLAERYLCLGIGGYEAAYVISGFYPPGDWRALSTTGSDQTLKAKRGYKVGAEINNQQVALHVDDIKVLQHRLAEPLGLGQLGLFAWGHRQVTFRQMKVSPGLPRAFVIMQFSEPFATFYEKVIKPAAAEAGAEAYNVSELRFPRPILDDIARSLRDDSAFVIAEITPQNQNVYYELGFSHALGKQTILIAKKGADLPFDLRVYRCIFYEDTDQGMTAAREELTVYIKAVLREIRGARSRFSADSI